MYYSLKGVYPPKPYQIIIAERGYGRKLFIKLFLIKQLLIKLKSIRKEG